ncbi:hypothetical protein PRZ48_008563 [Zasmidium cellare]|uniref:Fungal N-terminal domain-containing protein n=1 Tax=Zasmidium cellare TaxID=395010 RepID=A0ABR0EFT6_ZASCE|nr:hypothetical protein PRZ48_008563 [Zasmidium cellare]
MVVPFGVSVGDFITTLGLIRKIAAALAESHGSGAQFRKLEATLGCLERAVKRVRDTEAGNEEDDEFAARLEETTEHLKVLVEAFHKKIAKFQPSLKLGGSSSKWRDAFRKIQFTTIKDDIADFETQLLVQMATLQLLLEEEKRSVLPQRTTSKERSYLLVGTSPFKMLGMLYGILQVKFKNKPGLEAVKAGMYKLQDGSVAGKWSDVDVEKPYEQVFQSGGRWDMAMTFPRDRQTEGSCPSTVSEIFSEVHRLPQHFKIESVLTPSDNAQDTAQVANEDEGGILGLAAEVSMLQGQSGTTEDADVPEDEGEVLGPVAIGTTWHGEVRLEDLANVYLMRPPAILLQSPDGTSYMVPWHVFRTFQGLRFFAQYVCNLAPGSHLHLRDMNTNRVINENNWRSVDHGVSYDMMVELEKEKREKEVQGAGQPAAPPG